MSGDLLHGSITGAGDLLAAWSPVLAWRPFLEPIYIDRFWLWMVIPVALAISIVYKAIKTEDLKQLPRQVFSLTLQIVVCMALAAAVLWFVTEWV